jgi:hypothetical protein
MICVHAHLACGTTRTRLVIYEFDEADAELTLMPMASRRALDAAGVKLSLVSYQTLAIADRRELVRLGAAAQVDLGAVTLLVGRAGGPPSRDVPQVVAPVVLPEGLAAALAPRGLDAALWPRLTGLDRYVLDKLWRAGKAERLRVAFEEMVARAQVVGRD